MMGGGGYGPGMMGGGGYGPGMMGGHGPGGGMMGFGPLGALDLKDDQRDKIFAIQEEARTKNFGTMTQMRAEQYKMAKTTTPRRPIRSRSASSRRRSTSYAGR